jgi:hypothetical protein
MRPNSIIGQILATESVAFQKPELFNRLTALFADLQKVRKGEIKDSPISGKVSKLVQEMTGLNIAFDIGETEPCVEVPMVDKNNPLVNVYWRNWLNSADGLKMIDNADGMARGGVSIMTGKVHGAFCDLQHTIHLPEHMFYTKKFTPEEIAAVTLHEIGHLFTYYEFITRSVTTNQVLAGVAKAMDGTDSVEQREAILVRAKKQLNLKELDTKALAQSNKKKIVQVVIISQTMRQIESELGSNVCDYNTWEMLSDQFATRMGAGRPLVTALEKLYRGQWNISFRSTPAFLVFEAIKVLMVLAPLFIPVIGSGFVMQVGLLFMGMDNRLEDYDAAGARLKRVRDQIVTALKDKKLKPADRKRIQEDLHTIDEVMKDVDDKRQLMSLIWDFVSPSARRTRNQLVLQQQLEDLAANDLFIKSAELRQLA